LIQDDPGPGVRVRLLQAQQCTVIELICEEFPAVEQLLFRLLSMLVFGVFHSRITVYPKIEDARTPQNGKSNNKEIKIAHYIYGVPYFQTDPFVLPFAKNNQF
jgi:hypothetical protein